MQYDLTGSIVLYNSDAIVEKAIQSFLNASLNTKLFLIDNSPTNELKYILKSYLSDDRVEYIFNNKNIGFGAAHNIALKKAIDLAPFHLVLNPDIEFANNVLEELFGFMKKNPHIGQLLPQVLYKDGSIQKLCKLLPTPLNLLGRRFFSDSKWSEKLDAKYQLKGFNYDHCINLPNLSGCFMFLRTDILKKTGFFDTRYFMYMEDIDLTRRIHRVAETLFFPYVSIFHGYEKESYSNPVILKYHISSAIKYFNKWGWVFDSERKKFNNKILQVLNTPHKEFKKDCS